MNKLNEIRSVSSVLGLAAVSLLLSVPTSAEDAVNIDIEEVVVLGRLRSSAQQLADERMNDEVVSDVLGAEMISRMGDSTVALALRRIPGLSLVNDKFVYVRGLGERYSSTLLNGATVPSPDLTRNVIPLDVFPTSIVESLRVQKTYSADMPATFGGGSIDIRTKGIPDQFVYSIEMGAGVNSETDGRALSYNGGDKDKLGTDDGTRELKGELKQSIQRFLGNLGVQNILTTLRKEGSQSATIEDARLINRELATALNRDISLTEEDTHPDYNLRGSVGNNFYVTDDFEFGFMAAASYETDWREVERFSQNFIFLGERTSTDLESTHSVELAGNINLGVRYRDDHELTTTSLYLRNTDDKTAVRDYFNENRERSDGLGFREYRLKFEERELTVNQIQGDHRFSSETKSLVPYGLIDWVPEDLSVSWFYSDARAFTDIPNQVNVDAQTVTDPVTGTVISSAVSIDATTADYRFTQLDDDVLNYGWAVVLPLMTSRSEFELSAGYQYARKTRLYEQQQFSLGALNVSETAVLQGPLSEVFSDTNILDPNNNFVFDLSGTNNQSYIAATITDAYFAKVDWNLDETWRFAAGIRWEDYRQVALDYNVNGFTATDPVATTDPVVLEQAVFTNDKIYPSLSATYMTEFWAEIFQLRFGYSETTIRPDLREINDASYIDPLTGDLVDGNPGVVPSTINNFDVRAEWFFASGDNLTVSIFYKDIDKPIEFFESAASDTTIAREIVNATSAEVTGIEFEGYKNLSFLGDFYSAFFFQGNVTLLDTLLVAGPNADAPTNDKRQLTNASEYVVNMLLGYDSSNARHSGTLVYNIFGERLYVAGRNGAPDGFEQPFHSLDLTYSFYPTDEMTVKLKMQNLLSEVIEIEREGVTVFEQDPGMFLSLSFQYAF